MKDEDNNSPISDNFESNNNADFINAEDAISSISTPIFEEAQLPDDQQIIENEVIGEENKAVEVVENSIDEEVSGDTKQKKEDKVTVIFQSCLIIVLISAFVLVITIFSNKDNSFKAFLKTNPVGKVIIKEESENSDDNVEDIENHKNIEEESVEEPNDNTVSENNDTTQTTTPDSSTKETEKKKKSSSSSNSSSSSSNSSSSSGNSQNNGSNSNDSSGNSSSGDNSSSGETSSGNQNNNSYDIVHYGYIDLDSSKKVNADSTITRATVAKWLVKVAGKDNMLNALSNISSPFADVNSSVENYKYILAAYTLGFVSGDNAGNYNPTAMITRVEAATMVVRAMDVLGIQKQSLGINYYYNDVKESDWFFNVVYKATDYGIVAGSRNSDGTYSFNPDNPVKRKELVTMFYRAFNRDDSGLTCTGLPSTNPFSDMKTTNKQYNYFLEGYATHYCKRN